MFPPFQFHVGERLTRAGLRLGIVGWPTGTFLCVVQLTPLGPTILEPDLKTGRKKTSDKTMAEIVKYDTDKEAERGDFFHNYRTLK